MAVKKTKKSNSNKSSAKKMKLKSPIPVNKKALIIGMCICLAIAFIITGFSLTNKTDNQAAELYEFNKKIACGIDVSEHNKKIDFQGLKNEIDFVFIRVGYRGYGNRKIVEDKNAKKNIKLCEKAGIPYGVYFYSQAVTEKEARQEADFTLNMIKHFSPKLPIIIDFEYATNSDGAIDGRLYNSNLSKKEKTKLVNAFCQRVSEKGYIGGVYASSSVFANDLDIKKLDKNTFIWVADYNDSVTYNIPYTAWQYSKTGKLKQVGSKYVDLNYWYEK